MRPLASRQIAWILLACASLWIVGAIPAWACPNCRDAMASDPAQAGLVRGIFWSILFLLSMPFLILAGLGGYFYWLVHQAQRAIPSPPAGSAATAAGSPFAPESSPADQPLEPVEV